MFARSLNGLLQLKTKECEKLYICTDTLCVSQGATSAFESLCGLDSGLYRQQAQSRIHSLWEVFEVNDVLQTEQFHTPGASAPK